MLKAASPMTHAFAAALLLGSLATAPAFAQSGTDTSSTMQMAPAGKSMHGPAAMAAQVESRIKTLHAKLKITPDQESDWNDFAQAMRDNEANMSQMIQERHQKGATLSAVDDLQSYQKIAQAHADGMTKLISAFEPLYDSMSDEQKKNADEVFGRFEGHRGAEKASMMKKKMAPAPSTPDNE
jgi:hypothetical protein